MINCVGELVSDDSTWVRLQSFVYGDSLTSMLVAIVVPDPEVCSQHVNSEREGLHSNTSFRVTRRELFSKSRFVCSVCGFV